MAIDRLQEKIRKMKNPSVIDLTADEEHIPAYLLEEEGSFPRAYGRFCRELLEGLREIVPAVRFSFSTFSALGTNGQMILAELLDVAASLGYYVFLDMPDAKSQMDGKLLARAVMDPASVWPCSAVVVSAYIGSDGFLPYLSAMTENDKDLFVLLRTPNKTAAEVQDLLTGGRLVYMALADQLSRHGGKLVGKSGYSRLAGVGAASSPDSLRGLRGRYKELFLLLDGLDQPNGNAKNCSYGFDRLGHGAVACAGLSVTAAWQQDDFADEEDYVLYAQRSAERMKKNLLKYVTIL